MFKELWYDEVFSFLVIRGNWKNLSYFVTEDTHPPLYYVLLKLWAGVFGYSEFGLRSLSLLFFILTLGICYLWAKDVAKSKLGALVGISFLVISPFMRSYAVEIRAYSMFAFLFVSACCFLYRALTRSPDKVDINWMLFAVALPAMFITHYITMFILPAFVLFILGFHLMRGKVIKSLKLYVAISIPFLVIFSMYLPTFRYRLDKETNTKWIPETTVTSPINSTYAFLFGVDSKAVGVPPLNVITDKIDISIVATVVYILIIVVIVHSQRYLRDKDKLFYWLCVFMIAIPILVTSYMSLEGINFYIERYLIGMGAVLLLLLGVAVTRINYGVLAVPFYLVLVVLIKEPNWSVGYKDLRERMDYYGGTIVFDSPLEYSTAKYYMSEEVRNRVFVYDFVYQQDYHHWLSVRTGEALKELPDVGVLITTKNRNGELLDTVGKFRVYSLESITER